MRQPGLRDRRRGQGPGLRGQGIGGGGQQRELRARAAHGLCRRCTQTRRVATRHLVVVDRTGRPPRVRPGGIYVPRMGHHLRPHPRIHVRGTLNPVARSRTARGGGHPVQLHLTVRTRSSRHPRGRQGHLRFRRRGEGGADPVRLPRAVGGPHLQVMQYLVAQPGEGMAQPRHGGIGLGPGRRSLRLVLQVVFVGPPARGGRLPGRGSVLARHGHGQTFGYARRHLHRGRRVRGDRGVPRLVESRHAQVIGRARAQHRQGVRWSP